MFIKTADQDSLHILALDALKCFWAKLPAKDHNFAKSLLTQEAKKGGLTDKQWPYVVKLAEKIAAGALTPTTNASAPESAPKEPGPYIGVFGMFEYAKAKLKFPRIELVHGGHTFRVAKGTYKLDPAVHVRVKAGYGWVYLGSVDSLGHLHKSSAVSYLHKYGESAWDMLTKLAEDPVGFVANCGKALGKCVFCKKTLSDPPSLNAGYGPVCAKNYGLPWGDKKGVDYKAMALPKAWSSEQAKQAAYKAAYSGNVHHHPGQPATPSVDELTMSVADALKTTLKQKLDPNGEGAKREEIKQIVEAARELLAAG